MGMSSSNALLVADEVVADPEGPAALLRGTSRGLEMVVNGRATVGAIVAALVLRLEEAPNFFRNSDIRVGVDDGPLPAGCLGELDQLATRFGLRIIEVAARDAVPSPVSANLAAGSAPTGFEDEGPTHSAAAALVEVPIDSPEPLMLDDTVVAVAIGECFEEPTQTAVPLALAATPDAGHIEGPRLVIGPVRSGVVLEHQGHVIVFGDVNPGAELRATGNIIVLGRLRGTAHAGIGQDVGFILALQLVPQQLRIGRQVARAADSDAPANEPEIAYGTGDSIVVERYLGKLPRNLATSI